MCIDYKTIFNTFLPHYPLESYGTKCFNRHDNYYVGAELFIRRDLIKRKLIQADN